MSALLFSLVPLLTAAGFAAAGTKLQMRSEPVSVLSRYLAGVVGAFVVLGALAVVFRSLSSLPGEIGVRMSARLDYVFLSSLLGAVVVALPLVDARLSTTRGRAALGLTAATLAAMNYLAWDTYLYVGPKGLGKSDFWSLAKEERVSAEIREVVSFSRRAGATGPLRKLPHVVVRFEDDSWDTFFLLKDRNDDLLRGLRDWAPSAVFSEDDIHRVDFAGDDLVD